MNDTASEPGYYRDTWMPTASLALLQQRARLLSVLRSHFVQHGYWECETPILSNEVVVDANLEPLRTVDASGRHLHLQTSPEACMKRLLAAGATAIFQVARVMRSGERGRRHNPEFTMIEWYRRNDTHHIQMDFAEALVRSIVTAGHELRSLAPPEWPIFERLTYDDAFERHLGEPVLAHPVQRLIQIAEHSELDIPPGMPADDRDAWLNLLLAELVEPHLGHTVPQFIYNYPASQAALARITNTTPSVAERFELYINGLEICNGYHEITDPVELVRRTQEEQLRRDAVGAVVLPGAPRLVEAHRAGMPACAGTALGFDRLAMIALGADTIDQVIAFPIERA